MQEDVSSEGGDDDGNDGDGGLPKEIRNLVSAVKTFMLVMGVLFGVNVRSFESNPPSAALPNTSNGAAFITP